MGRGGGESMTGMVWTGRLDSRRDWANRKRKCHFLLAGRANNNSGNVCSNKKLVGEGGS